MLKVKTVQSGNGRKYKIDPNQFFTWIAALRSGNFSQGTGALQTREGYCCLGVACKVLIPEEKLRLTTKYDGTNQGPVTNVLDGGLPASQEASPKWLKYISSDFYRRQNRYYRGGSGETPQELIDLNDKRKMSFDEIADCLELVYVHGMFEKPTRPKEAV